MLNHRREQRFLIFEVSVNGSLGGRGPLRDIVHRREVVTLLQKHVLSGVEDRFPAGRSRQFACARALFHTIAELVQDTVRSSSGASGPRIRPSSCSILYRRGYFWHG